MEMAPFVILTTTFILLGYHLLQRKKGLQQPPSPPALPIIGHLHLLRPALHLGLQKLFIKYGPLISLRFGVQPVVLVSSPFLVEECFAKTNDVIFANRPESTAGRYFGYNNTALALTPYGDHWRNLRRVTAIHMFSSVSLHRFSSVWSEEIRFMVKKLLSESCEDDHGWRAVNLKSLFRELQFNVVMKMMAGKRWPSDQPTDSFSTKPVNDLCDYIPLLKWIRFGGQVKSILIAHEKRDRFVQDLINEARSSQEKKTVLQSLLSLQDAEPDYYTDDIIKGILQTMFAAATHSTALTMEMAMFFMLNHPEVLQKAKNEVDNNITQPGSLIEDTDLPNLPYLRCVINETLRLNPPGPILVPHYSSEDCTIGGFKVPKGTTLVVNAWAIQRDPDLWEEPDKVFPDRFEGVDEGGFSEVSKFIPFGKGRRACPASSMATRLVGLSVGTLLQCFEWQPEMVDMEEKVHHKPRQSMINFISQL